MTKPRTTAPRRRKGEGSVSRFHNHPTCPPVVDGERADHNCKGPYRAMVWVVDAQGQRKRVALYGKTEGEVIAKVKATTVAEAKGGVVTSTMTVAEWLCTDADATGWWAIASPTLKVNTRKGYVSKVNGYIIPALGHYRLTALQPDHVRRMYADMRKQGLSEASCLGTHRILRRALLVALREGKVARNVCDLIDPPKGSTAATRKGPKALTVDEAWRVLRAAGDNPRPWVALLAGVRQGEALGLRWRDVLLDEPVPYLVVREAVSREPGVGLVFDAPKSEASTGREVPLVGQVASRLRLHRMAEAEVGRGGDNDLVFPNPRTGGPMDARRDWALWTALLEVAGVQHVALHGARHTTAHLLEDAGVPDRVVADILGHAQVQVTHKYQKGNLGAKQDAIRALEAHMAGKDTAA